MNSEINKQQAKEVLRDAGILDQITIDDNLEREKKINLLQREKNSAQLMLKEWNDVIRMRHRWSNWLLGVIIAVVVFDFFVIIAVGYNWMTFNNNYIVPFFVAESLIKTLGLAIIVVKFLFNEKVYNINK